MTIDKFRGEQGYSLGRKAIDQTETHALSATPQNYEIWLHYLADSNPELTRSIEKEISENEALTDQAFLDIHDKYFNNARLSTQVVETGNKIAKEIADALQALNAASATTEQYGATLETASVTLENADVDEKMVKRLVTALSRATREMSEQNSKLNKRLGQSTIEIEELRNSLNAARAEALTDSLTGIANRKLFDETMLQRLQEQLHDKTDLCLVLGDIDHFKSFNDTWGHQTGDQVIRFVAGSLSKHALPDHLVARYGGEEFAIIMPRTSIEQAETIANNIRVVIESKKLMRRSTNEPLGQITVSFGIACANDKDNSQSLIERADTLLYESKANGRNRVTVEKRNAQAA